jgi:hypothetical protein
MSIVYRNDKGAALTHAELDNNFLELDKIPNGKVFPKEQDKGIKIDTDSPDWGWQDINGGLIVDFDSPVHAVISPLGIGGLKALKFVENSEAYATFHMPHDYAMGTDLFIHIHWTHNSQVVTGGSLTWAFELGYSKGYNQLTTPQHIIVPVIQDSSTLQFSHHIAETACSVNGGSPAQLNTSELEPDGILHARVYLDSNDLVVSSGTKEDVEIFAFTCDIHYKSTGLGTKNKNPNFWG